MRSTAWVAVAILLGVAAPGFAQHDHGAAEGVGRLGTVHFPTSCAEAAQPAFDRAVALLHSFEFAQAIDAFGATLKADPSCAMAEWGVAMSRWGNPLAIGARAPEPIKQGTEAVARARALGPKTPRERGYVEAVAVLFTNVDTLDQRARVVAYRDAMAALAKANPSDTEASIFYALAIAGANDPSDKTYAELLKAGAILEGLIERQPDHPGIAHYIIHSYDVPALADRALAAARRYAQIAPAATHALHMPSHTFTRVGSWQESIDTNIASGLQARRDGNTGSELHAMDYRVYAYLQTGQDAAARELVQQIPDLRARLAATGPSAYGSAGSFALAAIPARYALERGAWADAAALVAQPGPYGYPDALTWFAKALGSARSGDAAGTRAAIAELATLRDGLAAKKETYWAEQVQIQHEAASAWLAFAEGRQADGLAAMQAAAALEDKTEKAAVTPGPLAPARELVGEMLLQMNRPAEALQAFEATLTHEPNRFRALSGAARAAGLAGDQAKARQYAAALLEVCARADTPPRTELAEARKLTSTLRR
jgi:hypothetical protein